MSRTYKKLYSTWLRNTNRTYGRPYWPWLSLIQVGHIKDLIDHDFFFIQIRHIKDLIDHDQ
jgi:hypothetical protein